MTVLDPQQIGQACADAMWANDNASASLGMEIQSITPGATTMSMTVRPDMVNGHGICHGGMIFTLADSAFAFACNSHNLNAVAASAQIDFLMAARLGDRLIAAAQQVSQGRRTGVYDVVVNNQHGDTVALFRGKSHRIGGAMVDESTGESLL